MSNDIKDKKVKEFYFSGKNLQFTYLLMGLGVLALALGWTLEPQRTWANFLLNSFYFLTLSLSGLFFLALQYVSGARWSEVFRRIPEAMTAYLPIGGLLMLVLLFGLHGLYHWTHHDAVLNDPILLGKKAYLNIPFFIVRMVVILFLWWIFARIICKNSLKQDQTGDFKYYRKNIIVSAIFLVVFLFSFSIASFDWLMSLEPHWFSSVYSVYTFSGMFVTGLAVMAIMTVVLKNLEVLREVNENHFHDLGKLLFAFTMFWAYIWYFQYMLIWYGNIPEETIYYVNRLQNDWDWLFYFNFFVNFIVPFIFLLPREAKRSGAMLFRVSLLLLVGHWLDLYLMIMPGTLGDKSSIGFLEVGIAFGFAGLFIFLVSRSLSKRPILPLKSPVLADSLHHHQ